MAFWGIEVKPGKPYPYHSDDVPGRLHITQATLGLGNSNERSIVQCTIGHKSPIFLCSLLPGKNESCSLNLKFDEHELVAFSVIGSRSVHLSGYFDSAEGDGIRDDYEFDSYGEDIIVTESDESDESDFDTSDDYGGEYSDDEEDNGFGSFTPSPSPVPNSGVIIEEIVDDEKPANENGQSNSQQQIIVRGESGIPVLESEDEDGFPISTKQSNSNGQKPEADAKQIDKNSEKTKKKKKVQDGDGTTNLKRKVEKIDEEDHPEKKKKNKKNKQQKEQAGNENSNEKQSDQHLERQANEKKLNIGTSQVPGPSQSEEKKKKKKKNKKKGKDNEEGTNPDQTVNAKQVQEKSPADTEEKITDTKSSKVRTFPNGLVIEELSMGKPDGIRASPGKNVLVHYTGKLKKNGKIFDSNVGRSPFKFRLGTGQVISGWDVGVNGMRVGDKRRLTIPPDMGYGSRGAGGKIPPNSWLVFDVQLVNVL